jgi:hypothetical protein
MISTWGGDSIGKCEWICPVNMCLILSGYRFWYFLIWSALIVLISSLKDWVRFLFVGLDKERSLEKKRGYARRIDRSHFGCCRSHKETWKSTRKKKGDLRTPAAECFEVERGIFEHLLWTVTNLSFLFKEYVI